MALVPLPGAALKIRGGINSAARTMKRLKPALVAGFGGYPAFPALSAASRLKVPILIHEQNAVLGRVNRRFSGKAAIVASGFERLDRLPGGRRARKAFSLVLRWLLREREGATVPLGEPTRSRTTSSAECRLNCLPMRLSFSGSPACSSGGSMVRA